MRSRSMPYFHVVSYAFSRSKKTDTRCSRLTKSSRIKLSSLISWSLVLRFFRKPLWYSVKMLLFSKNHISRQLTSRSNVLQRQLVKAIGLYFPGSVRSFPGLGIGMTVASDQDDGKLPVTHKSLNRRSRVSKAISGRFVCLLQVFEHLIMHVVRSSCWVMSFAYGWG